MICNSNQRVMEKWERKEKLRFTGTRREKKRRRKK
jgi:hypothetical protein